MGDGGVRAKKRLRMKAVVLMATPCTKIGRWKWGP